MKNSKHYMIAFFLCIAAIGMSQTKKTVKPFDKVVISPHIEVTLVEGTEESVAIEKNEVANDKVNIEVKGKTLRIYLDDAKEVTKNKTIFKNGMKQKVPIYKGTILTVTITYRSLEELSVRGEQSTLCKSRLSQEEFKLKVYGESQVTFSDVALGFLETTIYGESTFNIEKGIIEDQKITAYGEGVVNLLKVENKTTKLRAYGEAEFKINASEKIKITAYGDARLEYKGTASIQKGIAMGDVDVSQID